MIELEYRNVGMLIFYGGKNPRSPRERINNKLNSQVPEPRIEPTTHWHTTAVRGERIHHLIEHELVIKRNVSAAA
jgi:hypothetical protein